jgi:signal recognition particle receptor subunit beta
MMQTIKMAVTGPFSAGKRAFIRGVNEMAFSLTEQELFVKS